MRLLRALLRPWIVIPVFVYAAAGAVLYTIPLPLRTPSPTSRVFRASLGPASPGEPEYLEEIEPEVPEEEILEESIETEEVDDYNEIDYDEDAGTVGLGDQPFVGPTTNASIGLGGGAGGGRRGRGGRRSLRAGGGSGMNWQRSRLVPNDVLLDVGEKESLPLERIEARVRVDAFRARVVLDCFFRNDHDRQLEGVFRLRLPNEASPFFFAFGETVREAAVAGKHDSFEPTAMLKSRESGWSAPKVARMVPREKAAHAYVETTHRRVDPALLEWAGAGVFNARVFPLAAGKLHRVVLAYDVNLTAVDKGLEYRLDLPGAAPEREARFALAGGARLDPPSPDNTYINFDGPITVRLPSAGPTLLRGHDRRTGPYFAFRFQPELPVVETGSNDRAVFLVDTSYSSTPERFNLWLELLESVLENNRATLKEFDVRFFNIERFAFRDDFVANTPRNVAALMTFCRGLVLEGATDLAGALRDVADVDADLFLLGDGAATWGERELPRVKGPLFAYDTGFQGSDTPVLRRLARATGGALFAVTSSEEVSAASVAHRRRPWRIERLWVHGCSDLLVAGRPEYVYPGQTLLVAGRGRPTRGAAAGIALEQEGRKRVDCIDLSRSVESPLAPRVYGQIAVGQLSEKGAALDEQATAYALHFRVPGKQCSLLMLDDERDYLRFDITEKDNTLRVKVETVGGALERMHAVATDPRAELRARLQRLGTIRQLHFDMTDALQLLLDRIDPAAPTMERLACRGRRSPRPLVDGKSRRLDHDAIQGLANRRPPDDALRLWSSLVEERPGDTVVARDVGYSALRLGLPGHAYGLFEQVARLRPHEPQTYLALAECAHAAGRVDLALFHSEVALAARWSGRCRDFRTIVGVEYLRLLRAVAASDSPLRAFAAARLEEVTREFAPKPCDLTVTILWNTDRTDVDLHVTDPDGEECYYSHRQTKAGGSITNDVTRGFGPEMFRLPVAKPGEYLVRVKYFGTDRNRLSTRTRVYATIEHRGSVRREVVTLRDGKEMHDIARLRVADERKETVLASER